MSSPKHGQQWRPKSVQQLPYIKTSKTRQNGNMQKKTLAVNVDETATKTEQCISDNQQQQMEEFEQLRDIYAAEITAINAPSSYSFTVFNEDDAKQSIILSIKCPKEYPCQSAPPSYSIHSTHLKQIPNRDRIERTFETVWNDNQGEPIMMQWLSEFQEFAAAVFTACSASASQDQEADNNPRVSYEYGIDYSCIPIAQQRLKLAAVPEIKTCARSIEDRKSVFKSFMCFVESKAQIHAFVDTLKSNKKIAKATHNMVAYRLSSKHAGIQNERFDDDGEKGGGSVILEILKRRQIFDVVVMVCRWYGGTHLGSDRFKHIKTMTQYVLEQEAVQSNATYNEHFNGGGSATPNDGQKQVKIKQPSNERKDCGAQILNRLYWQNPKLFDSAQLYVGCKCADKKLHDTIEFNLEEYGVQKNGVDWIEYISYKGRLIWDIWYMCSSFEDVAKIIQSM